MWVFTPVGFFSIVAHWDDPELLLVRGRARADVEAFAKRVDAKVPVLHTPSNDYPYRAILGREAVAAVVQAFVLDELTYPNFKAEVARQQGPARAHAYHDVWDAVRQIEDRAARAPAPVAPPAKPARKRKAVQR